MEEYEKFTDYFHEKLIYEIEGEIPDLPYSGDSNRLPSGFWKNGKEGLRRSKNHEEDIRNMDLPMSTEDIAENLPISKDRVRDIAKASTMLNYWSVNGVGSGVSERELPQTDGFF